ncbi:hypothetical protein NDU88_003203 [Pleurodeles waltl]|uniref:Secreted protein n=1 Tax=Pleurodeles waltl TaxID=8319 RepID=A0AAV7V1R0_PLEWA|nr:hypothetical protein NDU88_003203 [Pleurodeles waltl]
MELVLEACLWAPLSGAGHWCSCGGLLEQCAASVVALPRREVLPVPIRDPAAGLRQRRQEVPWPSGRWLEAWLWPRVWGWISVVAEGAWAGPLP